MTKYICIIGKRGSGKTFTAIALANQLAKRWRVGFRTEVDLASAVMGVRSAGLDGTVFAARRGDRLTALDYVVLDGHMPGPEDNPEADVKLVTLG